MNEQQQLAEIQNYIYNLFHNDITGHDYYHMKRVASLAKDISHYEHADYFLCEVAAWVHDVGDKKLTPNPAQAVNDLDIFLKKINFTDEIIMQVKLIIKDISFSSGNLTPDTIEGKIVQDADRLDAIGAIGIARTFAYGGANSQLIYSEVDKKGTSVQHFYDKLFKLKSSINTVRGNELAQDRHNFTVNFINQFQKEW